MIDMGDRNPRNLLIKRVTAGAKLPTVLGNFETVMYSSLTKDEEYLALVRGELSDQATLVRIHSQCLTGDVFGSVRCDCGAQLKKSLEMIAAEDRGVILYQFQEGRGIGMLNKMKAYSLQDQGIDTVDANEQLGFPADLREYNECAAILVDLGLSFIRLITNNPSKIRAVQDAGLRVERIPIEVPSTEDSLIYLRAKKNKLGHYLDV